MTLRSNIVAGYASQIVGTLVAVAAVPLYLQYMGAEAFGLVGFFTMLQVWFNLLDLGLTPTIGRETARLRGGATTALEYRRLFRMLHVIFIIVAVVGAFALLSLSRYGAESWFKAQTISSVEISVALQLMALIVGVRWLAGLYRGVIAGQERLVWMGGFDIIVTLVRLGGVVFVFEFIGTSTTTFFLYFLLMTVVEVGVLATMCASLLPPLLEDQSLGWSLAPVRRVLKFSLTIALTSSIWVLVTQTDKLVLSKLLPLDDYGYFTLAVLAGSTVMLFSGPIASAVQWRISRLDAEGDQEGVIRLYRSATQIVTLIALPMSFTLAWFAEPVVWAWTGNRETAMSVAPILSLYALGNGVLAVAAFPYYLQYARGDLRLHLIGNVIFVVLLIPSLIWATLVYRGVGAGYAWLVSNLLYFFVWIPVVHRRIAPGIHLKWLGSDIAPLAVVSGLSIWLLSGNHFAQSPRFISIAGPMFIGLVVLAVTTAFSRVGREQLRNLYRITAGASNVG